MLKFNCQDLASYVVLSDVYIFVLDDRTENYFFMINSIFRSCYINGVSESIRISPVEFLSEAFKLS